MIRTQYNNRTEHSNFVEDDPIIACVMHKINNDDISRT